MFPLQNLARKELMDSEVVLENLGKIDRYRTITKHNQACTMHNSWTARCVPSVS